MATVANRSLYAFRAIIGVVVVFDDYAAFGNLLIIFFNQILFLRFGGERIYIFMGVK